MAVLRLPGQELDRLMREIDLQITKTEELAKKIDFNTTVTRNLLRILKHAHEKTPTDQDKNSGRSDTMEKTGAEQKRPVRRAKGPKTRRRLNRQVIA